MRRKAQVQTQIFIYIIAIVILGMVLVFGYKAIKNFGSKSDEIEQIQFKTDMEGTFKQIRTSFGQVQLKEIRVPTKFIEVCVVDIGHKGLRPNPGAPLVSNVDDLFHNPLIAAGVQENNNVFLIKGLDVEGYDVGKLKVDSQTTGTPLYTYNENKFESNKIEDVNDGYILCFKPRQGKLKMRLKGMGDYVFVTQP